MIISIRGGHSRSIYNAIERFWLRMITIYSNPTGPVFTIYDPAKSLSERSFEYSCTVEINDLSYSLEYSRGDGVSTVAQLLFAVDVLVKHGFARMDSESGLDRSRHMYEFSGDLAALKTAMADILAELTASGSVPRLSFVELLQRTISNL
jgi:hypothetical protein